MRIAVDASARLAGLKEAVWAAHGDWHELTNLWSIHRDLDWLLRIAERASLADLTAALPESSEKLKGANP